MNDSDEQARLLSRHARRLSAKVNLIPYNNVSGLTWTRPSEKRQEKFLSILRAQGNPATLRREKGHDIDAACGQLRLQTEREALATHVVATTGGATKLSLCPDRLRGAVRHTKKLCAESRSSRLVSVMAGYEGEPERAWDEYQWEHFLQQQESKAEKYMQLLEEYLDDPQRDEIIAREMGWTQLLDSKDWSAELNALPDGDLTEEDDSAIDEASRSADTLEGHDLYRSAFALTIWIDHLFDRNALLQNEPAAVKLATQAALANAKLAAALSSDSLSEIGMTIAYLKRALKAITISMDAAVQLRKIAGLVTRSQYAVLRQRLFQVRDGIVTLMGEYRGEWRRRFGPESFRRLNEIGPAPVQSCKRKRLWLRPMCRTWIW